MADRLAEYRRKRDAGRTPEPVPGAGEETSGQPEGNATQPYGNDDAFVVQEHHASALHWDFRLERQGVLVSWAVPKGLPPDPADNHLAVQTEDHPLDYAAFAGTIPRGEYGGGSVSIWDTGRYELEKWTDREVKVVLHGSRVQGRFALIHTKGKNWIMHRMDGPAHPEWQPLPRVVPPMLAVPGELPSGTQEEQWAFETKWDGARAVVFVDGGRPRALSRNDRDVTVSYPELRAMAASLGTTQVALDGELVAFGENGLPSFSRLQRRMHVTDPAQVRRLASTDPVVYVIFDLLHLDGRPTTQLPYLERRRLLESLQLNGDSWQTPRYFTGSGADLLAASKEQGLEGIVAKRLNSRYRPGHRSPEWRKIKNIRTQEVIVGGWRPGNGRRSGTIGSLLMGVPDDSGLRYVGSVGTGFSEATLSDLLARVERLGQDSSPFDGELPRADVRDARWIRPELVGEVTYAERTPDGRLRHPSWRGLRPDKAPSDVTAEP